MKQISTGAGLLGLGVCMVATAFIAIHRGGTEAFAQATQQTGAAEMNTNTAAVLSGCSSNSESWFSPSFKVLGRCISTNPGTSLQLTGLVGVFPLGACDVNGDGTFEHFDTLGEATVFDVYRGGTRTDPVIMLSSSEPINDSNTLVAQTILLSGSQTLTAALQSLAVNCCGDSLVSATINPIGWRDIDRDGDKDLVCVLSLQVRGGSNTSTTKFDIWFENTGYQSAPAPNPYDLDQDGEVGASDISVLLLNYSK